ncbi:hypothetical protein BCR44DRAFT_1326009 [Catenaria anguillulae PL171]|uniref:Uncharacterized protein n=1 Tax=Catenaria anguillulae PL171 TaxID=765915 RepID=A0A1Y2H6R5_9FUNG|nr:hypothetical protein BCR44DRAFT_1326009 [Catenaria anguillulae PL171]
MSVNFIFTRAYILARLPFSLFVDLTVVSPSLFGYPLFPRSFFISLRTPSNLFSVACLTPPLLLFFLPFLISRFKPVRFLLVLVSILCPPPPPRPRPPTLLLDFLFVAVLFCG